MTDRYQGMIFVFGSNAAGVHGAGAGLYAAKHHGAIHGRGEGLHGSSYALPTKHGPYERMTVDEVREGIERFISFARSRPDLRFALTPVGTGLGGHSKRDIWSAFARAGIPANVFLTAEWISDAG